MKFRRNWNRQESLSEKILVANTFYLSPKEKHVADSFTSEHEKCKSYARYIFDSGSGIGVAVAIECAGCGTNIDITDLNYW